MDSALNPDRRHAPHASRRRLRDDRGQTLLEFALASVGFFILVFGTIEFGRAVWQYNMMSDLAQQGARWAAVHGSTSLSPASAADLQAFVQSRSPGFTVNVTAAPQNPSAAFPGGIIVVQVDSSFSPLTALVPAATLNLTSTARMTVFR
jgi:Flp pilus assembly protein TadG